MPREREKEIDRNRARKRERKGERERDRQIKREREKERKKERKKERERKCLFDEDSLKTFQGHFNRKNSRGEGSLQIKNQANYSFSNSG